MKRLDIDQWKRDHVRSIEWLGRQAPAKLNSIRGRGASGGNLGQVLAGDCRAEGDVREGSACVDERCAH